MSRMIFQALLMSVKDTKIFFTNRFAVAFALAFPFLFILGFTLALGDVGSGDKRLTFYVASEDTGDIARDVMDGLLADPEVPTSGGKLTGSRFAELEYAEAVRQLDTGEIEGFIALKAGFSEALLAGEPATPATPMKAAIIEVAASVDYPQTAAALQGIAKSLADITTLNRVVGEAVFTLGPEASGDGTDFDRASVPQVRSPVSYKAEQVGDVEPFNASSFTLPGYLVMFVFFAAAMGAQEIARERESHTLERLMSNGVRRESIILGKFLTGLYRGMMQLAVLWIVGIFAFGLDLGVSPVTVVGISVLMVVVSAAFAVTLAALVKTRRSADSAAVLVSLVLAPLGGSWWPLFITPDWMQALAKITPHGWANQAFNKLMLFGATAGDVTAEMAALVVFAALFLAVALWRFRPAAP
jgi:ABC-2 type transport system permease protein